MRINRRPVAFCAFFLAAGIAFAYYIGFSGTGPLVGVIACAGLLALLLWRGHRWTLLALYALVFFLGTFLFGLQYNVDYSALDPSAEYRVTGRVSNRERLNQPSRKYTLSDVVFANESGEVPLDRDVLVYSADLLEYGDLIAFAAKPEQPSTPRNPGGFDEKMYLAASGAAFSFYAYDVAYEGNVGGWYGVPLFIRETLADKIDQMYTEETAPVAKAMFLGIKDELPDEMREEFSATGIAHVLAISGLHVTILAAVLDFILKKCKVGRTARFITEMIFLVSYAFITAFAISVVRAVLMSVFVIFGRWKFLKRDTLTCLCAALLLILLVSPAQLFAAGLLMSFGAVFGLLCLMPPIERWLARVRFKNTFSTMLGASGVASVAIAPLTAYYFGNIVWIAPLANFYAIPLATVIVAFTGLSALIALLAVPVGSLFALVSQVAITFLIYCNNAIARSGVGAVPVEGFPVLSGIAVFAVLYICSDYVLSARKWKAIVCGALIAVMTLGLGQAWGRSWPLTVTILDVGGGDAIHIRTEQADVLIDNGGQAQRSQMSGYAESNDITFDYVIAANDRSNNLGDLIAEGHVTELMVPENYEFKAFEQEIGHTNYALYDTIDLGGGAELYVAAEDGKHYSYVLRMNGQNICLLMQNSAEEFDEIMRAPIVKLPGGGELEPGLVSKTDMGYAVISARTVDEPAVPVLEQSGVDYAITAQSGAVTIRVDADGELEIETMK